MEPGHEDREYARAPAGRLPPHHASMEPGHEDREYLDTAILHNMLWAPQWSPVMKTGNTTTFTADIMEHKLPQWSPVMKTGNTPAVQDGLVDIRVPQWSPVMKTGNTAGAPAVLSMSFGPQWSPVMKTGNTSRLGLAITTTWCLNGARS